MHSRLKHSVDKLISENDNVIAAVPDLHGNWLVAKRVLAALASLELPVVFLGDYVDRGRSSVKTIEAMVLAQREHPTWRWLRGNHDDDLLRDLKEGTISQVGQNLAIDEYRRLPQVPPEHLAFLERLPLYWETANLIFVHAGIFDASAVPMASRDATELLWTYEITAEWKGKKIVRGHRPVQRPTEESNCISLEAQGWLRGRPFCIGLISDDSGSDRRLLGWVEITSSRAQLVQAYVSPGK